MSDLRNAPVAPSPPLTPEQIHDWLTFELDGLKQRKDELLGTTGRWIDAHPTIDDDEAQGAAAENRRMLTALSKTAEERRKERKNPFLEGGRAVDGWFAGFVAAIDALAKRYTERMTVYAEAKVKREQEAAAECARLAQQEADRQAAEAAAALEGALPEEAAQALDKAATAAVEADRAQAQAEAPIVEHSRVRGEFGAVASLRTIWKYKITDPKKVPRNLCSPDDAKIKAAIVAAGKDASGKPKAVLAGIEIYPERKV